MASLVLQAIVSSVFAGAFAFLACPGAIQLAGRMAECIDRDRHLTFEDLKASARACLTFRLIDEFPTRILLAFIVATPFVVHGIGFVGAVYTCAYFLMALILVADARTGYLPDALLWPLLWLTLGATVASPHAGVFWPLFPGDAISGALAGYATLESGACLVVIGQRLTGVHAGRRDVLGGGDVKFGLCIGALLGVYPGCVAIVIAGSFAILFSIGVHKGARIRLGPYLVLATLFTHAANVAGLLP